MDLRLLKEGQAHTLYALQMGKTVDVFLADLQRSDEAEFARIMRRLEYLADHGTMRKREEFNDLGADLFEAKSYGGARVIFFYEPNRIVICAHAFLKKTQKTPKHVLATARDRREAYRAARARGEKIRILISPTQREPERTPL